LVPTGTFPNCVARGEADTYPALRETPDPLNGTASVPFAALLISFNVPEDTPALCGVNLTLNVAVPPAPTFKGRRSPCTVYPLPVTVSPESVTAASPVFAMVTLSECVRPTQTRPKSTEFGVNVNWPLARAAGALPAPINARSIARQGSV